MRLKPATLAGARTTAVRWTRSHGYEHAYRDGADQGRQDREAKLPYSWRDNDYWGARGYERAFGDQNEYMEGYREGYQAGYDDGYYGLQGQYGQIYGRPQSSGRVPTADPVRRSLITARPTWRSTPAIAKGSRSVSRIASRNTRSNYRNNSIYKNGDLGYRSTYGDRNSTGRNSVTASTAAMKTDTGVCKMTPRRLTPTGSRIAAAVILRRTRAGDTPSKRATARSPCLPTVSGRRPASA